MNEPRVGMPLRCIGFFGAAAEAMRRILVENARRKRAQKHGGDLMRHDLQDVNPAMPETCGVASCTRHSSVRYRPSPMNSVSSAKRVAFASSAAYGAAASPRPICRPAWRPAC